jgi:hypothetical protein
MRQRHVFDERYFEQVRLPSGHEARIRLMRSDDRLRILQAPRLGSRISLELDFFCSVEQVASSREVSLIAVSESGAALGGARGFRIRAGVWHSTVTAVDTALTSLLLDRISSAMLDRGACEVRFEFAPDDLEMWRRLLELAPRSSFRDCDERIHCTVSLR